MLDQCQYFNLNNHVFYCFINYTFYDFNDMGLFNVCHYIFIYVYIASIEATYR